MKTPLWEKLGKKYYNGVVLNITPPQPRCTEIEALYNLVNEENKSATLKIRSFKCWEPPTVPPPNVRPVSATTAAALSAAADVHTTNADPSSQASPDVSIMA